MCIELDKNKRFGKGRSRNVYLHPFNDSQCIKIQRASSPGAANHCEIAFFNTNLSSPFYPKYYGQVKTNLGTGLVVGLIKDFDGQISKSLVHYLDANIITRQIAEGFILDITHHFISNKKLIHDANLENILLQKDEAGNLKPVLIDGFGAKDTGVLYFLRARISMLAVHKTKKLKKRMLNRLP
ncbi:hypothetical protein GCM10007916_20620 [Psychromonas marina]|uniref:Protein kinase domain-containing protein n=1 Tax=Psychromonas marina TaxID=88364 RepID=A0ABQ6E1B1_9GAMM|nr:YrbL family protein [Psychromonas marina]GLS90995.1 hypothetical protein GCM10007916_20620 [Psychromonas marina]